MKHNIINDLDYGYLRLDPIPSQQEVEEFYAKEFYASNETYFNDSALSVQKEQEDFYNSIFENIFVEVQSFFNSNLKDKKVFDIGFGFAQALIYLKGKGLDVAGIEPSKEGVEFALKNGIKAFHTDIENFDCVGDERFDIVLLINVLEHLRKPAETLINIKEKLIKEDGILVIDVPNDFNVFQDVANKEYNLNDWWVVAPNHINYFSVDSLKGLLEQCGYEVVKYETSFPLDIFLLFGEVYVGNSELGKSCHNKRILFEKLMRKHGKEKELKNLYKSLADLNIGRQVTFFAKVKNNK